MARQRDMTQHIMLATIVCMSFGLSRRVFPSFCRCDPRTQQLNPTILAMMWFTKISPPRPSFSLVRRGILFPSRHVSLERELAWLNFRRSVSRINRQFWFLVLYSSRNRRTRDCCSCSTDPKGFRRKWTSTHQGDAVVFVEQRMLCWAGRCFVKLNGCIQKTKK